MEQSVLLAHCGTRKLNRVELTAIPAPEGSLTHRPIPHYEIVSALIETLGFRQIGIVRDEYAVSGDGMKMFGVLDLETSFEGCRFSIGLRNSNDKSMRLALTIGLRLWRARHNLSYAQQVNMRSRRANSAISAPRVRFFSA